MKRVLVFILICVLLCSSTSAYALTGGDLRNNPISTDGGSGSSTSKQTSASTPKPTATPKVTPSPHPTSTPKPASTTKPIPTPKAAPAFSAWYDESAPIARNSKIESIIGKTLYIYAYSDVDSAILAANKSGIEAHSVKYEDAYPRSIDVRYDENSNRFAGVIELRWKWKYQGQWLWHSWYYTFTGSYVDEEVIIDTSEQLEENKKALNNVNKFWKDNWPD